MRATRHSCPRVKMLTDMWRRCTWLSTQSRCVASSGTTGQHRANTHPRTVDGRESQPQLPTLILINDENRNDKQITLTVIKFCHTKKTCHVERAFTLPESCEMAMFMRILTTTSSGASTTNSSSRKKNNGTDRLTDRDRDRDFSQNVRASMQI